MNYLNLRRIKKMDIKLTKTGDDAYTLKIDSIRIENISMGELSTLSQLIDTD